MFIYGKFIKKSAFESISETDVLLEGNIDSLNGTVEELEGYLRECIEAVPGYKKNWSSDYINHVCT